MQAVRKPSFTAPSSARSTVGDVGPAPAAGRRGEHRLGDLHGAAAVGEQRRAVGQVLAANRRRTRRRRRRRSSRRSPAGGRPAARARRAALGVSRAGSRGSSSVPSRWPRQSSSGFSWSKASASSAASNSIQSRFLRPGETWLTTTDPSAPPSVSNWTSAASSVSTARADPLPSPRSNAGRPAASRRSGIDGRGARREARDALAGGELGQVAPVRADVGERARAARRAACSTRQLSSLGTRQPVLQVGAVQQPQLAAARRRAGARAPRGPSGSSGRRTAPPPPDRGRQASSTSCGGAVVVERERLLADHVLAGLERGRGERDVQVVRRADVDDVDVVGVDQLLAPRRTRARRRAAARRARRWRPTRRRRRPPRRPRARPRGRAPRR